jgi:aminoglycoside/choline kinase family phosphotransferase
MDARYHALSQWVAQVLNLDAVELSVVSGDASFRRYFRYAAHGKSWIAMDAPPEKEDSTGFIRIARHWLEQGIRVPEIIALDLEQGFLLLSDFGDCLLLGALNPAAPDLAQGDRYYRKAMQILCRLQSLDTGAAHLPAYNSKLLQTEMALFSNWLIDAKLGLVLSDQEKTELQQCFDFLEQRALAQAQVIVHRDYHARNLMICDDDELGVLDFQDAVIGPLTYDLLSLLRDCYIVWPDASVTRWCREFYDLLAQQNQADLPHSFEGFKEDFDLMGLQRHIKVAGIFCRLSIRDGKHGYLNDIPRTLDYILRVANSLLERDPQGMTILQPLVKLIEQRIYPRVVADSFTRVTQSET